VADMIREPPAAPVVKKTVPFANSTMMGQMEDRGRFPGAIKFAGDGSNPKELRRPGCEKSSISLFLPPFL